MRGELGGGADPSAGGGGIFSCRSNRWGGGEVWGITGSLLLVLAVYSVCIVLCMGRGGGGASTYV